MWNHFKRLSTDQYKSLLIYLVAIFGYVWMIIAFFPSVKSFDFDSYLKQMPEGLRNFYQSGELVSVSTIEGFLSGEFLSFFFILIILFYAGSTAGSAIAGKIEKGQMDFSLSQPIGRSRLFAAEFLVALVSVVMLTGLNSLFIYLLCPVYNISISSTGLWALWANALMIVCSFLGLAFLFSSFLRSKVAVIALTCSLALGSYLFTTLALSIDKLKDYKELSLFHYYKPADLLTSGDLKPENILILLAVFIISSFLALFIFNKKDV